MHYILPFGIRCGIISVAVGLYQMLEVEYIDQWFCSFAAGAVIISIPVGALFLATQKYYVEGVSGAVKG